MDKYRTAYKLADIVRQHIDMGLDAQGDFSATVSVHIRKRGTTPDVLTVTVETTSTASTDYAADEAAS